jgi:hypothetical protein
VEFFNKEIGIVFTHLKQSLLRNS